MGEQPDGPRTDLYAVLGVNRDASREEIAQAWRQRVKAEHPDFRPGDVAAPARFRALAEAYRVLGDPAGRARYDRAAKSGPRPGTVDPGGTPRRPSAVRQEPAGRDAVIPVAEMPDAPLRAGPVWVEPWPQNPAGGPAPDDETVAELVLRYLGRRGRPW
jgi:curved DNA-binding protein CbpA